MKMHSSSLEWSWGLGEESFVHHAADFADGLADSDASADTGNLSDSGCGSTD